MVELIELNTERLRLRQWRAADREPFAQLNADPRVMEFFPSPLERSASDAMAEHIQSLISERGWGFWAVEVKEGNEFIGFVGLHTPAPEFPFSPCVEVFELLHLPEIVSFTAVHNRRSRAVMDRLGMCEAAET